MTITTIFAISIILVFSAIGLVIWLSFREEASPKSPTTPETLAAPQGIQLTCPSCGIPMEGDSFLRLFMGEEWSLMNGLEGNQNGTPG